MMNFLKKSKQNSISEVNINSDPICLENPDLIGKKDDHIIAVIEKISTN
jgi:hypothetical protein